MKKEFNQMVKAIEVTKRYSPIEVKKLSQLFLYLNNLEGLMDEYKYGVSAKGLWKLLAPLTRTGKEQRFDDWWKSVSNIARLKASEDYVKEEILSQIKITNLAWTGNSDQAKKHGGNRGSVPVREVDYILTLRAGEYCATLTKGDAGDLYRRFIFDIKDEFIRLVFRRWKSVDTRVKFTNAIAKLPFVKSLEGKEQGRLYAKYTNRVYVNLQDVEMEAKEYKAKHGIAKKEIAKHYIKKDGLLNLEEIENGLWVVIVYASPNSEEELDGVFEKFFFSLSE